MFWKDAVLNIIRQQKGKEITLQEIYRKMLGHSLVTDSHKEPWKTGKQPKYQCWVRRVLTDLVREGLINRPRTGVYKSN